MHPDQYPVATYARGSRWTRCGDSGEWWKWPRFRSSWISQCFFLFRISAVLLLVRELQKSTIQKRFSFDEWTKWIAQITVPPFVSNWSTSNAGCKFSSRSSNSKERHMAVGDLRQCPWILPSFEKYGKEAALRNNSCNMVARSNPCGDNVIWDGDYISGSFHSLFSCIMFWWFNESVEDDIFVLGWLEQFHNMQIQLMMSELCRASLLLGRDILKMHLGHRFRHSLFLTWLLLSLQIWNSLFVLTV